MADLDNYTFVKATELVELTEVDESSYIVITDGASSKKIKAILLKGQDGETPTFQIGAVSTLIEGSDATVNMTNIDGVYTINFGIPRGESGSSGTGSGITETQLNQLSTAYAHSQSTHVQPSDIPTKTSQLTNNSGFATESYVTNAINNAQLGGGNNDIDLSIYQTIQDNTLTTTAKTIPTAINELKSGLNGIKVPTKTSELTNNSGFITTIPDEYITETELNAKGYLTSHQDISNLQSKTDNSLATTDKTVVGAINELKSIINTLQNKITALENQQDTSVKVTGVTLSTNTLSMKVGGTTTLTANTRPSDATNKSVTWSTNNNAVASVSNGVVTAKAKGQATITVTTADGGYTDTCIVTVSETVTTTSVTGVTLNKDTLAMNKIGGTQTLSYTITPSNATNKNVTWSTSVPTVASVNNGLITANANGTTVITIRTTDGGHTDTCTVTVNDPSYVEGGGDDTLYVPDIASYGISKDGTNSEATTNGLNRLFVDLNKNKKTNVQLPTGTYAINPDISLTPKSNLTLDLNNSKLKIDTNGKNGSTMIYLKEVENLTLKNGTIEGDRYDHDYATYNENTTSHEFNVGLKLDQGARNINIDNVKFTKITGYGLAVFQGTQYCNTALDKTIMESGDYNDSGNKVADATKIRYPQVVNITEHATHGYLQVGTLLKYQNYVFNSTRTVTVRMFDASGSLLSKVTSKMYRPIAVPSNATTARLTFHQSDPKDYLDGDMYTLDVFHMKPPRDCNITNCTFDDNRCLGIAICGGWNIKIEGNTFKNTSKPTSDTSSPNYQHGKPGYGIDIEDGWESTQDLTIHNNVFTNNGYGDIVSLAGDNTVITHNQFSGRVAMYSRNTNYVVQNNTITNGIAMWETEKDYGFKVDHNTYTDTTIKAKCYKPYDADYYTFTNETITNCEMQLDTSITLKNSTINLDGTTGSRFTGSYDTCTITDFDGTDANSDYNTGIKLNNCNVSKCNFFPSKDTIMTNNVFNTFRVRLDNGTLVFTGNEIQSNPKNTSMPIVQLNGGKSATIKNNTLGSAVTVSLYRNDANIEVITDDSGSGESG